MNSSSFKPLLVPLCEALPDSWRAASTPAHPKPSAERSGRGLRLLAHPSVHTSLTLGLSLPPVSDSPRVSL